MEDKLYFLKLSGNSQVLTPCRFLSQAGGSYYFQDVTKTMMDGIVAIPEDQFDRVDRPLRSIAPTQSLLACLGAHGIGDQKRISIAIPDEHCIVPGYVGQDEDGYYVSYDILDEHRRIDMRRFGLDFCAVPLGQQVYPWTYSIFDPVQMSRNVESDLLVNAQTKGLRCFLNHPDFQFVLKIPKEHLLGILRHAASQVYNGSSFSPGEIVPFTYQGRNLKIMEAASSDTDDTVVYRLVLADKNGLFPEDEGVEPVFADQNMATEDIMGT